MNNRLSIKNLQQRISKQELEERYAGGESYAQIGASIGLNESRMSRLLLSYQIIGDPQTSQLLKFLQRVPKDELLTYLTTNSIQSTCKHFNISKNMLTDALIYYNEQISPEAARKKAANTKKNLSPEARSAYYEKLRISSTRVWENRTSQQRKEILDKALATKRNHHSFTTSKPEQELYSFLISKYDQEDVEVQYDRDERYPFHCDFYIKSLDLFIELNLHWTHGEHPFNQQDKNDIEEIDNLAFKARDHEAILSKLRTWLSSDPTKFSFALGNNLNYIAVYENAIYYTTALIDLGKFNKKAVIQIGGRS